MNEYPCTTDLPMPLIAGGEDMVLAILNGALRRYRENGTDALYIGYDGQVCAVGAVLVEAGITREVYSHLVSGSLSDGVESVLEEAMIEQPVVEAVKQAMALLDESAVKLFPESADYKADYKGFMGPLEWLNQRAGDVEEDVLVDFDEVQQDVIACYEDAIDKASQSQRSESCGGPSVEQGSTRRVRFRKVR